jgi:hypothetical protein
MFVDYAYHLHTQPGWGWKSIFTCLTLILLMWRIWWAPNSASRWQMGLNSAFEGLREHHSKWQNASDDYDDMEPAVQMTVHWQRWWQGICNLICTANHGRVGEGVVFPIYTNCSGFVIGQMRREDESVAKYKSSKPTWQSSLLKWLYWKHTYHAW